jgi:hypothetical protein
MIDLFGLQDEVVVLRICMMRLNDPAVMQGPPTTRLAQRDLHSQNELGSNESFHVLAIFYIEFPRTVKSLKPEIFTQLQMISAARGLSGVSSHTATVRGAAPPRQLETSSAPRLHLPNALL